jgi:hypothetical protein
LCSPTRRRAKVPPRSRLPAWNTSTSCYILVLLVIIGVFLVVRQPSAVLIQYRNNSLPKLLYWPISNILFLLSTLAAFVYGSPS